jgi:nuclear-control-of-ATPase protein 2
MQAVMQAYAEEIRTPVRSALSGKLFRAGLIQVQEIKVNLEAEFVTLQRLLEAQQLNLQALAMLPALFASVAAYEVLRFVASVPFTSAKNLTASCVTTTRNRC